MSTNTYHHGDLRQALISEAGKVLETEGAGAISLRGLARTLGVSHAAPGHHFADRDELLAELAADGYAMLADALEQADTDAPTDHKLVTAGHAYIDFALGHPERYRMMFASQLMGEDCPERLSGESTRAYMLLLQAIYGKVPEEGEYRMAPAELAAWSAVHGAVMLWIDGQLGQVADEDEFRSLTDTMLTDLFA